MVDLSTTLPILLYIAGLVLLIVLIIVGIKLIGLLDKFDRIADNIEVKVSSLDGAFNFVDKFSDSVAMVSDSLVSTTVKLLSNVFGKGGFGKFLTGALLGAGIGFLASKKTGEENRADLKVKLEELKNKVSEVDAADVKKTFDKKIKEISKELENLDKEKAYDIAEKQAKVIKAKLEDLAALAKEKGTPVLKDASKAVKEQAILFTKDVLKKLETEDKK